MQSKTMMGIIYVVVAIYAQLASIACWKAVLIPGTEMILVIQIYVLLLEIAIGLILLVYT